jgi:hypothetical protein
MRNAGVRATGAAVQHPNQLAAVMGVFSVEVVTTRGDVAVSASQGATLIPLPAQEHQEAALPEVVDSCKSACAASCVLLHEHRRSMLNLVAYMLVVLWLKELSWYSFSQNKILRRSGGEEKKSRGGGRERGERDSKESA